MQTILGNSADSYNQIWHLPTADNPPTGKEWVEKIAGELKTEPKYMATPRLAAKIIGLFMPVLRETVEMMYQYEGDYFFDSSKFEKRFDFTPASYSQGIKEIVSADFISE